ncbi:DNA gyrase subunit B [Mycoplasma flocculare]|uniref:DNA topoisomerase (ATP-hydrolyzing) n=2 Tax=Mesomycoplasma flocculare TaxID=2128 RepID=A0A0A8E7V2_MESFC|nr:DNA gyrase subunit B [Mesomycoplasma flocculare]MXR39311.1 DNA gyrase subunit B [Mycoplasma sp. MF12]AJC49682.1 DNA gyrase subunit B [Mesomycoplasma flocculare ATCC 27399]ENX51071.1 DNA gyrase subunit B [Mesomycoplasma flocculare ATCC 27716]MXR05725.1 DNA gyrase subunit B [Mesomycoplasma flocculare]MXR12095.1 DNA gyrase subunit B [Mesomycoplasma flocculare]
MSKDYQAENIVVLEGLEAVRKRPGMYIGGTGINELHHLVWEIVDNAVDEALAGFASKIKITILDDFKISIEDNGRGIPVGKHPKYDVSAAEVVFTVLHAGGKFDGKSYKVSGGLHGVGASVVNGLAKELEVFIKREGKIWYQKFTDGGQKTDDLKAISNLDSNETGTKIIFSPDFQILEENSFQLLTIISRIKNTAYLTRGIKFVVSDNRSNFSQSFCFDGGIRDYVVELSKNFKKITDTIIYAENEYKHNNDIIKVEFALNYVEEDYCQIKAYTNNIHNPEGGSHENGLYDALLRILNNYALKNKFIKSETDKFLKQDIKDGLIAIVSIKHSNPIFEGQTKGKLTNKEVRQYVNKSFSEVFERYLAENPDDALKIIKRNLLAQKAARAAKSAREAVKRKSIFDIGTLPGKLADCSVKNPQIAELYIVEGNSAGGSAKMGRDRHFQAILPLRGKVINSQRFQLEKVLRNEEILSMITAFGTGVGPEFDINKIRYQKIIIMTDADSDGSHIRSLLLTFLFRYFKKLIEFGFVYIAIPPLYKISQNKKIHYAYNEVEKEKILAEIVKENSKFAIQRYKGLGEMNPEQLWETTMNPKSRRMSQVQIHDAEQVSQVFDSLMGIDVSLRKIFIEENAQYAKIDI